MGDMVISELFQGDYKTALHPIDRRMKVLADLGIDGMSTENIRLVMNELVRRYAIDMYVEVGTYKGCSLLSAALYNDNVKCYGIDNFSQFNGSKSILTKNIEKTECKNVFFIDSDYRSVIPTFQENSIDVYFYDGDHSYAHQVNGLDIIKPYMKNKCIIVVDDSSWGEPRQANIDWLSQNPDFSSVELTVDGYQYNAHCNNKFWWNGLTIMSRGISISI